jgi:excisionase family DNA binding protein
MASQLLKAAEVAEILGLHSRTPYDLARDGLLPVVRLSRRAVRFRREDVEQFIRDHLVTASRAAQGLPDHVEDKDVLGRVAGMVGGTP